MKRIFLLQIMFSLMSMAADIDCFPRNYLERGNFRDKPRSGETGRVVSFAAARGEYEPAQLLIRSTAAQTLKAVVAGDLRGSDGALIPAGALQVGNVLDQKRWHNPRQFERLPYVIMPCDRLELKADETARLWLTLHVPDNAVPGQYTGSILLQTDSSTAVEIPLAVEVYPFTLPDIPGNEAAFSIYYGGPNLHDWFADEAYTRRVLADMRSHNLNSAIMQYRTVDDVIKVLKEENFNALKGKFIWIGAINAWKEELARVNTLVENLGMELMFYGIDEPTTQERFDLQRQFYSRFKKESPDNRVITALQTGSVEKIGDALDIWMVEAIDLTEAMIQKAAEAGKELYAYECRLAPVDAHNSRFFYGFLLWRSGAGGACTWYYGGAGNCFSQIRDRYNIAIKEQNAYNPDYQYNFDYVFCVPDGFYPSISWEGIREGIDDRRYIFALEKAIQRAKAAKHDTLADSGKQLLAEIHADIHPDEYGKRFWKAYNSDNPERNRELGVNFFRPDPEFTPDKLDGFRRKIAGKIIEINMALGKH